MNKKSLVAFLFLVAVGLLFSGCCQIMSSLKPAPAGPCVPYEGCFSKDDCKPGPCVERDGCFFPVNVHLHRHLHHQLKKSNLLHHLLHHHLRKTATKAS